MNKYRFHYPSVHKGHSGDVFNITRNFFKGAVPPGNIFDYSLATSSLHPQPSFIASWPSYLLHFIAWPPGPPSSLFLSFLSRSLNLLRLNSVLLPPSTHSVLALTVLSCSQGRTSLEIKAKDDNVVRYI